MKPNLRRVLLRSLLSTSVFMLIYGVYLMISRAPDIVQSLIVIGLFWFATSVLLERFVYWRFERD